MGRNALSDSSQPDTRWKSAIVGYGEADPAELTAHPQNWRQHPARQATALSGVISDIGWIAPVILNRTTGHLVDGHLRVELARQRGEPTVPVAYVELTPEQEAEALLTFDPIAALAETDRANMDALLRQVESDNADMQALLSSLAEENGLYPNAGADGAGVTGEGVQRASLSDRFIVPPFSVLDARQGYWQERKRQWLALGIQSELGRGGGVHDYSDAATISRQGGTIESDGSAVYRNAAPGGSPRPAASLGPDGKTRRGNGKGGLLGFSEQTEQYRDHEWQAAHLARPQARLTWVAGDRAEADLDDVSRKNLAAQPQSGTSIFDPVLCELVYRWFSPPGGAVLDPFAGGSVRGIVAAVLGRTYTSIDLSERQIAANEEQAVAILTADASTVQVKVSAAMARQEFNGCDPDYIRDVCHAACCQSSTSPTGTLITIHPSEIPVITARGGVVANGLLQPRPGERVCPFKTADHLCGLHFTPDKPFGCIASPFTLTKTNTLIVRNRYRLLRCYQDGARLPAYRAFRASLDLLFGQEEAARITAHLDAGGGDCMATMPAETAQKLRDNDGIKHGVMAAPTGGLRPRWIVGDSGDVATLAPGRYDLVFSCPPYADLERYSDDPRDLSTMDYPAFLAAYRRIIAQAVALLADDRFACFVVGDVRDKRGLYRNFVSDTIAAFQDAGAALYNEAILVTAVGSLPIRVGKQFSGARKLGKTHQNVLIFCKGDPKRATSACGPVEVAMPEDAPDAE